MAIIVALGNPGDKYKDTRHNVAWLFLDHIYSNESWKTEKRFQSNILEINGDTYLKPLTYMNRSGISVYKAMSYYKLLPKSLGILNKKDADLSNSLIVIHDDVDMDFGKVKITQDSGSGGHNGIKSIINHLKTRKFIRIKIGIKNELLKNPIPTDKFVLQKFKEEEKSQLNQIFDTIDIKKLLEENRA